MRPPGHKFDMLEVEGTLKQKQRGKKEYHLFMKNWDFCWFGIAGIQSTRQRVVRGKMGVVDRD